ncbi:hypothetical protein [Lichenicoccus sp.]|uniref:hypothetical protein n=1 Tax=Lichenicoccus sp. TaxID=2781899 RepID=UPI003D0EB305
MHITGERQVPAPRERVWKALADAGVLQDCLPGLKVTPEGNDLVLSGLGDRVLRARPTIREPFATLGWRIDPASPATQMLLIRLAEHGVYTRLSYEISLADLDEPRPQDTSNAPGPRGTSDAREQNLQARVQQALDRFIQQAAGPAEIGAGGLASAVQAATEPGAQPTARMTAEPSAEADAAAAWAAVLNPAAIGGVLFLVVLLFMVGIF